MLKKILSQTEGKVVDRGESVPIKDKGIYPSINLRELYIYLFTLLSGLYGQKCAQYFKEMWLPIMSTIIKKESIFNWDSIISLSISQVIAKEKRNSSISLVNLCMSSYSLEVICASNAFLGLGWAWMIAYPLVDNY